jgi:ribokinase
MTARTAAEPNICVIGACNIDLISYAERMPRWGETLPGRRFQMGLGGKGANQAVMAAKLGAKVTMVGKVGRDVFGTDTLRNFKEYGVDTRHVHLTEQAFTGVAPITVNPRGQNAIVVVTGANDLLTEDEIEAARPAIRRAAVVVCQWEIPIGLNLAALRIAREYGVRTIFNPAPARRKLPAEIYRLSDIFCPNESETELLTGRRVGTLAQAERAGRELLARGVGTVVLTLGSRGCLMVGQEGCLHVPARRVRAMDSTGAGDAFVGSLAYYLGAGLELPEAARRGSILATLSVLKSGTQTSFPSREEAEIAIRS